MRNFRKAFVLTYLQPQPPSTDFPQVPLLQKQKKSAIKIGSKQSELQTLSIIPLMQPLLQTHKSKSIISMYKQQLSLPITILY